MRLSYTAEQFVLYTVCILIIVFLGFILRDIYHMIKKKKEIKNIKKLTFDQYEMIKNASLDDYIFYAPYGVSQSLITFISESPNFISALENINQTDYPLTKSFEDENDPHMKDVYLSIAIQLSNIVSNSGKILVNRCNFYCENISESFQLKCDAELVQKYCKFATMIHDINTEVKKKHIESPEIVETLSSMYQEFINYFKRINSLITFIPNEKGETNNV